MYTLIIDTVTWAELKGYFCVNGNTLPHGRIDWPIQYRRMQVPRPKDCVLRLRPLLLYAALWPECFITGHVVLPAMLFKETECGDTTNVRQPCDCRDGPPHRTFRSETRGCDMNVVWRQSGDAWSR